MATIDDIIKGLRILAKYQKEGMQTHINGADHDIIYGTSTQQEDIEITDQAELHEAGWHWSQEFDCWCHFV